MTEIEIAVDMYKREHSRWHQWALFFFGTISSVFIVRAHVSSTIPIWIPCLVSALLCFCWVVAGLAIRGTTYAWEQTIKKLGVNENPGDRAFAIFATKLSRRSYWGDFCESINIFQRKWWSRSIFSVTRILVLIGLFFGVIFLLLAILFVVGVLPVT